MEDQSEYIMEEAHLQLSLLNIPHLSSQLHWLCNMNTQGKGEIQSKNTSGLGFAFIFPFVSVFQRFLLFAFSNLSEWKLIPLYFELLRSTENVSTAGLLRNDILDLMPNFLHSSDLILFIWLLKNVILDSTKIDSDFSS